MITSGGHFLPFCDVQAKKRKCNSVTSSSSFYNCNGKVNPFDLSTSYPWDLLLWHEKLYVLPLRTCLSVFFLCFRVELVSYMESMLLGDPFEFLTNWPPVSVTTVAPLPTYGANLRSKRRKSGHYGAGMQKETDNSTLIHPCLSNMSSTSS